VAVNYRKLVEGVKAHGADAVSGLAAALAEGAIATTGFDAGKVFAECFGWHAFHHCRDGASDAGYRAYRVMEGALLEEAAGANSTDAFLNITQQFAYAAVLKAYDLPKRVFVGLIPKRPSKFKFERVPGITHIGDEAAVVDEGKPYPEVGVGEDWIDTPETRKRGMVARATKEVVFFDQTGQFMDRLGYLGDWLGVNDEKRAITAFVDAGETSTNQYRYTWRNTKIQTYGDNTGAHTWDNLVATNALVDYTNVATAWNALVQITDPYTGEPQDVDVKHIVVPPLLAFTVPFALKGMVRRTAPGYATTGNPAGTEVPNPVADIIGNIQTVSSQLFRSITGSDSTWFLGDVAETVEEIENWPLTVATLGAGSQLEFDADVVFQSKVSKRSTFNTKQPRKCVKCTA
jgi:hypothetical protein